MADPFIPKFADLVRNYTTTTGTTDFNLGPAANGYASLTAAMTVGDRFYYSCIGVDKPAEREIGRGTLLSNGKVAREPVSGSKTSFTSGTKSLSLIAASEWYAATQGSVQAIGTLQSGLTAVNASVTTLDGRVSAANQDIASLNGQVASMGAGNNVQAVADRSALAALATSSTAAALLEERGREGLFVWDQSNLSASVLADPAQGVFVAPSATPSGASGAWVRRYSGARDARWFGAKGDGSSDDRIALQAWLDLGDKLYLPLGQYYSSTDLILRKNATIEGAGYGPDSGVLAGYQNQPGSRIRFAAGKGFIVQHHWVETDVATVLANPGPLAVQTGAQNSVIRDIAFVGAGSGATATGFYCRTVIHLENVHAYQFTGKGFDLSASSDMPDGNSEYGNLSLSTLKSCVAKENGSHGFHVRGRDASLVNWDSCNAQQNGGWGFIDDSLFGGNYINCHAAANTLGAYSQSSNVSASTYTECYVEPGVGNNCHIRLNCNIVGGALAGTPNDLAPFQATTIGGGVVAANAFKILQDNSLARLPPADGEGWLTCNPGYGITAMGRGYIADYTITNRSAQIVGYVPTNTLNLVMAGTITGPNLSGTNTGDQTITLTGDVAGAGTGSFAATIANGAVTYSKLQNVAASCLLGNPTGAATPPSEISIAGGLTFSGTTLTAAGALTPTSVVSSGTVSSSSATAGVGYGAGAGGTVAQATSKATGVTLNKVSGRITTNAAALAAAAIVEFTVTNSAVAATDTIILNLASGASVSSAYRYWISAVAAGSFKIAVENRSAASLSEALVLNFAVMKAVAA